MKRIISLLLSLAFCVGCFAGCSLVEKDRSRDYAQDVAVIDSITQTFVVDADVLNEYGEPVYEEKEYRDDAGNLIYSEVTDTVKKTRTAYTYTSPKKIISKGQLMNYVEMYGSEKIQNYYNSSNDFNYAVNQSVADVMSELLDSELELIEANKLFYAGALYWTQADVDEIQRSVYDTISQAILQHKNRLLAERGIEQIEDSTGGEEGKQTTFPVPEVDPEPESPKYFDSAYDSYEEYREAQYGSYGAVEKVKADGYAPRSDGNFEWFDKWYSDADSWYIKDDAYLSLYPGMSGNEETRSLDLEAMNAFLDEIFANAELIIGITDDEREQLKDDVDALKAIRDSVGAEYTYGELGATTLIRLLVGNSYMRNKKLQKLQDFKKSTTTVVGESQVMEWYDKKLKEQKLTFGMQAAYDSAVNNDELILYTPTNRYVFVKHILLKFNADEDQRLVEIKAETGYDNGYNEDEFLRRRAELAANMTVYPHLNGENDLSRPMKVSEVWGEIKTVMAKYQNSPKDAERAFDELIYKYNADPGIFTKPKGYAVLANPSESDTDQWMAEFADGGREFRQNGYNVGEILDHYVVTDSGIHIMYYASDPKAGEVKSVSDYITPGKYVSVYETIENLIFENLQSSSGYNAWRLSYLKDFNDKYVSKKSKTIKSTANEIINQLR